MNGDGRKTGYGFGTFQGVFTPSILTIIGVVMYLRFGWVLGSVGLFQTLVIVTVSSLITFLTGLSVSALSTNMKMGPGGAYYMISRSFGVEIGAAVGIPLFLSQAVSVAFYVAGFSEAFIHAIPFAADWDGRLVGLATLAVLAAMSAFSADWSLKSQYVVMAAIVASLVSFFFGSSPAPAAAASAADVPSPGFFHVLAVFFPAVTGILSGIGMSGDLRNPAKSLPRGTIAAVLTGWAIYMAVPIALYFFVPDKARLLSDPMIMQKCARISWLIVAGVWAASLSSALGGLLAAPRTLQALARDGASPRFFARGHGRSNDPRYAALLAVAFAAAGIWLGDVDHLAPVLTIFNLTAYALLNLSSALEEMLSSPAWRPSFRVPSVLSFTGFSLCAWMMFMISPGATFVAAGSVFVIWWIMTRRELSARWGDMRTGLFVQIAHWALRSLAKRPVDAHAWRPNLLVFSGAPGKRPRLAELASALSLRRSLATYAAVVTPAKWSRERVEALSATMRQWLARRGVDAQVRVQCADTLWAGVAEMVRSYGYGALEPNTLLFGDVGGEEFAAIVMQAISRRKNVVTLRSDSLAFFSGGGECPTIDVWWRGKSANASFLLALAYLIHRRATGGKAEIRLCHLAARDENASAERRRLEDFLAASRVKAQVLVLPLEGDVFDCMERVSARAGAVVIGLRAPRPEESAFGYAEYFDRVRDGCSRLPQAVFACTAEEVDFKSIFGGSVA